MERMVSYARLARNVALLLFVGLVGLGMRWIRRRLRLPPRIWRGMFCSHLIPLQVRADRAAGFESRSVVTSIPGMYELVHADEFTITILMPTTRSNLSMNPFSHQRSTG